MNDQCCRLFFKINNNSSNDYENYNYFNENYNTFNLIDDDQYSYFQSYNDNSFLNENNDNINNNNLYPQKIFGLRKREKPGKKRNLNIDNNDTSKKPYIHTKIKFDNILTKVNVSYVNFLVDLVNIILDNYGRKNLKFKYLDSKIKKNNKISFRKQIKKGTIGDILKNKISPKYTTLDENNNFKVYEKLEKDGLFDILNILENNFLFFFENVYYKNIRKFNLKDFGLMDLEVELPKKVKLYENLLKKSKNDLKFIKYKEKMSQCIKKHFLGGLEEEEEKEEEESTNTNTSSK